MDVALLIAATVCTLYLPSRLTASIITDSSGRISSTATSTAGLIFYSPSFPWGTVSLGLSLVLFTLSIIEVAPSSWLILIDNSVVPAYESTLHRNTYKITNLELLKYDDISGQVHDGTNTYAHQLSDATKFDNYVWNNRRIPLTTAYLAVLWAMSFLVLIILPSSVGIYFANKACPQKIMVHLPSDGNTNPSLVLIGQNNQFKSENSASADQEQGKKNAFSMSWSTMYGCFPQMFVHVMSAICKIIVHKPIVLIMSTFCFLSWKKDTGHLLVMTEHDVKSSDSIPKILCQQILRFIYQKKRNIMGSVGGITVIAFLFSTLCPMIFESTIHTKNTLLTQAVSWLTATGIVLSAIMNGFGSVSMPYMCLAGLYLVPFHPDAIEAAEVEREKLVNSIENRLREMNSISIQDVSMSFSSSTSSSSKAVSSISSSRFNQSKTFAELGEDITHRKVALLTEIEFLESLLNDVTEDLVEMKETQIMAVQSRTTLGIVRSYVGVIFSIILLSRLISSFFIIVKESKLHGQHSIIDHSVKSNHDVDIVTQCLFFMIGRKIIHQTNYDAWAQLIALVLAVLLSYSQMKVFLRTAIAINHRLSGLCRSKCYRHCLSIQQLSSLRQQRRNNTMSNRMRGFATSVSFFLYSHLVAGLMSCYCIAGVVLTKMILPHRYRAALSNALSGEVPLHDKAIYDANYEHNLFRVRLDTVNFLFICAATVSAITLGIALGIRRQNTHRYLLSTTFGNMSPMSTTSNGSVKPTSPFVHRNLIDHIDNLDP